MYYAFNTKCMFLLMTKNVFDCCPGRVTPLSPRTVLGASGKRVAHTFSPAALDEAGVRRGCPPFAVVASDTMDLRVGR